MSKNSTTPIEQLEIAAIMENESGRNVVRRLLQSCGYFSDTFDRDLATQSYIAGRRSVAVELVAMLNTAAPGQFQTMLKEHFDVS